MVTCFVRTLVMYFSLVVAVRLTGKRQIGELQVSELVITYMLSELAVFPITDKNVPLLHAIVPILLLLSLEVIFSFLQTKSGSFRRIFSGSAAVLISHGKIDRAELQKNRIDLDELLGELRLKGAFDIADVEYAFLEENGKLSVQLTAQASPLTPKQLELPVSESGCAHAVIVDGEMSERAIGEVNLNCRCIEKYLDEAGVHLEDVFLMTLDDAHNVTLVIDDGERSLKIRTDTLKKEKDR